MVYKTGCLFNIHAARWHCVCRIPGSDIEFYFMLCDFYYAYVVVLSSYLHLTCPEECSVKERKYLCQHHNWNIKQNASGCLWTIQWGKSITYILCFEVKVENNSWFSFVYVSLEFYVHLSKRLNGVFRVAKCIYMVHRRPGKRHK